VFQAIGKVINVKPVSAGLARSLQAAMIIAKATECSQGQWQAVRFRSGRLTITAPSPIAAQELSLRRNQVLEQINRTLGGQIVNQILIKSASMMSSPSSQ
jgi:hypothetical protein